MKIHYPLHRSSSRSAFLSSIWWEFRVCYEGDNRNSWSKNMFLCFHQAFTKQDIGTTASELHILNVIPLTRLKTRVSVCPLVYLPVSGVLYQRQWNESVLCEADCVCAVKGFSVIYADVRATAEYYLLNGCNRPSCMSTEGSVVQKDERLDENTKKFTTPT